MFRRHRQQVLDAQVSQMLVDRMRREVREDFDHSVLDRQKTVGDCQADRTRCEALGHRIHAMRRVGIERRPVCLGDDGSMVQDQQGMQVEFIRLAGRDEIRGGAARRAKTCTVRQLLFHR